MNWARYFFPKLILKRTRVSLVLALFLLAQTVLLASHVGAHATENLESSTESQYAVSSECSFCLALGAPKLSFSDETPQEALLSVTYAEFTHGPLQILSLLWLAPSPRSPPIFV